MVVFMCENSAIIYCDVFADIIEVSVPVARGDEASCLSCVQFFEKVIGEVVVQEVAGIDEYVNVFGFDCF